MSLGNGLRPHVSSYTEFDMAGWPPGRHRGLPSAGLAFVLSFSSPLVVRSPGRGVVSSSATVAGLTSEPVEVLHDGTQRGLQLELTPHGARALLGIPAAVLAGGVFALEEVVGQPACELVERLAEASNPVTHAQTLATVLRGWQSEVKYPETVDAVWHRLVSSRGAAPIGQIATEIGLGRRHLGELVRNAARHHPKNGRQDPPFRPRQTSHRFTPGLESWQRWR